MNEHFKLTSLFNIDERKARDLAGLTFVGIDFGTSTTVVSVATYNPLTCHIECRSLYLSQKDRYGYNMEGELFPSVIAMDLLNPNQPIYGQGAYDLKWDSDYTLGVNIWYSFKMELGKNVGPSWYESCQSKIKSPQDATCMFFKFLKRSIEKAVESEGMPKDIKYAVSIPASFESNQRRDLMKALEDNGIEVDGSLFIDEPNAAFMGYINSYETAPIELRQGYNPKVLVFDFGAGTCDISLLEITADHKGMHSKNLSISQFAELGGNDIDRYIAHNFLLPQLLKANGIDDDYFTVKQKDRIVSQLLGKAENIKKRLCDEDFRYLLSDSESMDEMLAAKCGITVDTGDFTVQTNDGNLTVDTMRLTYADFIKAMEVFFQKPIFSSYTVKGYQKKYNSIQTAIDTALDKAHVGKSEVDYVIMIGGSSRNPFVQQRIKAMFNEARVMIPRELQTLVSRGAALHSILSNGLNIQAIRPIAGDSIIVVSQDDIVPVIQAGTEVPFEVTVKDVLTTGRKSYMEIEIPVCVGRKDRLVHNLKLRRQSGEPFPEDTLVALHFEMDSDKILHVKAETLGEQWMATCENPLDNTPMTKEETKVRKAQRESYMSAVNNGNKPTEYSLRALARAYEESGNDFMAAETLVELMQYYPDSSCYNEIGVLFHNAGNYNKALEFFRKALDLNPESAVVNFNHGHDLYLIGEHEEARSFIEKALELRGDYATALTVLARIEETANNDDEANGLYRRAYNIFKRKWDDKSLDRCSKGWFMSVAKKINSTEVYRKLQEELAGTGNSLGYSEENTLFKNNKAKNL